MEVKNLYDPAVKQEIISRINKLTADSKPLWGKMNASQMLAHCQKPLGVATGSHTLKPNFIITDQRELDAEKERLITMITTFSEANMSGKPHPFFGKLTNEQWCKGTWKHLDHHLQQFGV